ncbi:hypothetical protein DXG01_012898 [Tephrocybe rancida]|nr:hypothetical protein DXG01_012898 [Tephrocybe rancida]
MAGALDNHGPAYISVHSADVILSEIRPIKLKIEALQSINLLLDEFLFSILKTAGSLQTDNLRASLLSLLPTTLGKEALLEAEVELRAYWERTTPPDAGILDDDSKAFHLQWAFEILRLKCEAFSTLNESDEDQATENRINDRMSAAGGTPPKAGLVAPAALYLTAILEAMCEHILTSVGRVAARDSSRTNATAHDLYIALCEDDTIYGLFKSMRAVYEQIEQLSTTPKVRKSKSFTKNDKFSRTSSPHHDMSSAKEPSGRSRLSSDSPGMATNIGSTVTANPGSRSSFEKTRAMKMFKANSRSSIDADPVNGHKRSDSLVSEKSSKHTATLVDETVTYEDEALQQEFDDLMRSSSTMKVSLTPDRLKTMEAYKQEKERGNRRPNPQSFKPESDPAQPLPPRATGRRPSLLHVDSIKEDDEEGGTKPSLPLPTTRNRQASVSSPPTTSPTPSRVRSVSTSSPSLTQHSFAKPPRILTPGHPTATDQPPMQNRRYVNKVQDPSFPPRTRNIQRNRESLDLDDVMAGSDDDEALAPAPAPKAPPKTPKRNGNGQHVSAGTRDLIAFLSEGPPDLGGPLTDIAADGPPYGSSPNGKTKGTGRLQRMISKLSLSNGERSRGADDFAKSSQQYGRPFPSQPSLNNLSSLANRPIPPRPPPAPRPISPPASPHDSSEEHSYMGSRSRSASLVQRRSPLEANNRPAVPEMPAVLAAPVPVRREHIASVSSSRRPSHTNGHAQSPADGNVQQLTSTNGHAQAPSVPSSGIAKPLPYVTSPTPPRSPVRKPPPVYVNPNAQPHLSRDEAQHMHRLFTGATTADECRLILDMFLARAGIPVDPKTYDVQTPSPPPSAVAREQAAATSLEASLLELFLGGENVTEPNSFRKNGQLHSETLAAESDPPHPNGAVNEDPVVPVIGESIGENKESTPLDARETAPLAPNDTLVEA